MIQRNQLKFALSPYLLQHAQNPVHWQMWTDENLESAKNANKLLIISIGYAACHWCHVMEREAFEDKDVAEVMNNNFINFKIDREELPAVDALYMQAAQLITKQVGWPLNIVALPNGIPVWAATYVPKDQWIEVLTQLSTMYFTEAEKMYDYAQKLHDGLTIANNTIEIYPRNNDFYNKTDILNNWQKSFDWEYGGYLRAPKFMMPSNLFFLFEYALNENDKNILNFVKLTLKKMAYGGLFDVIEGGFSRYSVDHKWHIPHFEKMLYDNAQLIALYTTVYLQTQNSFFKEIARKTIDFIINNWSDSSGGFYAAFDADSKNQKQELKEGAYYTWSENELQALVAPKEWKLFTEVFSINSNEIWDESKSYVLFQKYDLEDIAYKNGVDLNILKKLKKNWEHLLYIKRHEREKPLLDDKIITSWNALLLSAFLKATHLNTNKNLNDIIHNLSQFLQFKAYNGKYLGRVYKKGENYIDGTLEDYAFTIEAFISLFNHSQNINHLNFAKDLTFQAFDLFFDTNQGFFKMTNKPLIGIIFEIEDNVIPSANAVIARNIFYIGMLFSNNYFIKVAKEMVQRVLGVVTYGSAYSEWLRNDLIFNVGFEYLIVNKSSDDEIKTINSKNSYHLVVDNSLNIPILDRYKNQTKKFQICTLSSCRLQTNDIRDI